ncbi:hypothetical protein FRC01_000829, partial [Tulasnella sp. 417]
YLFNWGLFGVLCLQVYIYFLSFPRDSIYVKSLVYGLFAIDCLQTAMTTHNAWHFLSRGWGDLAVLGDPVGGGHSGTQNPYIGEARIWKLSRSWWLPGIIACVALAQGIAACVSGIWFAIINDITKISSLFPSATVWLGGSALVDVMITVSLVSYLAKANSGFSQTDDVISKLIRMTVETGAVTATAATVELILFLVYKTNNLHMNRTQTNLPIKELIEYIVSCRALALAKLYTNTLLATLNARSEVFNGSERSRMSTMARGMEWRSNGTTAVGSKKVSQRAEVTVTTHTVQDNVAMVDLPKDRRLPSSQTALDDEASFGYKRDDEFGYGYLFNYGLYGILILQTYIYYLSFPKDSKLIKSLVYGLFFLDTIQTVMTTHNAWHFLSEGWGRVGVLADPGADQSTLFVRPNNYAVQLFFSWRIWKLSGFWWLAGFISCAALAQGISACVTGIWFAILNDITKIALLDASAGVWLAGSAITDLFITVSLVWVLQRKTQGGLTSNTEDIISRLIRLTVQTGAVTTFAATAELIMYLKTPENNLHMIPGLALSKLYTNTLMATLNARSDTFSTSQRSRSNTDQGISMSRATRRVNNPQKSSNGQIQVTTIQETMMDDVQMVNLPVNRPAGRRANAVDTDAGSDDDDGKAYYSHSTLGEEKRKPVDLESGLGSQH